MKKINKDLIFGIVITIGLLMIGCDKTNNPASNSTTTGTGLFKTSGTFSFSSTRGNFLAEGIFDTLMSNASASGAFQYSEGKKNVVVVMAYNVISQNIISIAFAGIGDTTAAISNDASYSFSLTSGSKVAIFGYIPNAADTSSNAAMYVLTKGAFNVSTLTASAISGSFTGSGISFPDTTKTITLTNGSCNSPIVDKFFNLGLGKKAIGKNVEERIKTIIQRELFPAH